MITCDVIKYAYRQSKDGFIVSFVVHPQEMPAELANADIGSQWQLSLVSLDEQGNARLAGEDATERGTDFHAVSRSPRKASTEKRLAQQAGMLCADPVFRKFIDEECRRPGWSTDETGAADFVRGHCGVGSRSEIVPGSPAAARWDNLYSRFIAWRDAPELVA